jgi:hypothetical protein
VPLDLLLDAQRRLTDAETEYVLNRSRYSLALKNVHFVKGTLLEYDGVFLAEGGWPGKAYSDSAKREKSRSVPVPLNYASSCAPVVSRGAYSQQTMETMPTVEGAGDSFNDERVPMAPTELTPASHPMNVPAPAPLNEPTSAVPATRSSGVVAASATQSGSDGVVPAIHFAAPAPTENERAEPENSRRLPPLAK